MPKLHLREIYLLIIFLVAKLQDDVQFLFAQEFNKLRFDEKEYF